MCACMQACVCACVCASHCLSQYVSVSLCVALSTPPPSPSLCLSVSLCPAHSFERVHVQLSFDKRETGLTPEWRHQSVQKESAHFPPFADELLRGFFQFYSQMSLSSLVIQIRPGTVTPLSDFLLAKLSSPVLKDFKVVCCG